MEELKNNLGDWYSSWLAVLEQDEPEQKGNPKIKYQIAEQLMRKNNPIVIPRNHHVEAVLESCENALMSDLSAVTNSQKAFINSTVEEFLEVLRSPYQEVEATKKYQEPSGESDKYYRTFCGT